MLILESSFAKTGTSYATLLLAAVLLIPSSALAQSSTPVEMLQVVRGNMKSTFELPATIKGFETVEIFSKVGGFLSEVNVDIGDQVTKDQVIARLHVPEMEMQRLQKEAQVRQAEAEWEQAKATVTQMEARLVSQQAVIEEAKTLIAEKDALLQFESSELRRVEQLVSQGAVNSELLDAAKFKQLSAHAVVQAATSKVHTAEAEMVAKKASVTKAEADQRAAKSRIDVANANLAYTRELANYAVIKAPFSGVVTKRWFDPGTFVQSADGNSSAKPIVEITRVDKVRVSIMVSMGQVNLVDIGDAVTLRDISGLEHHMFFGQVSRMSGGIDFQSRTMEVEVDLDNPDGLLIPGHFGYAEMTLVDIADTTVVPSSAVHCGATPWVFVISQSKAAKRNVTIAANDGKQAAVLSGLAAGDEIIKDARNIQEGQAVTPK